MSTEFYNDIIADFKTAYKYYNKIDYIEDKGDEKACGMLIAKFRKTEDKLNSEQMRKRIQEFFVAAFTIPSLKFYKDNATLKLFNGSQAFNAIRNAQKTYNKSKYYAEENYKQITIQKDIRQNS